MKKFICTIILLVSVAQGFAQNVQGAWKRDLDTAVQYLTIVDNYFSIATFNVADKKFIRTRGGTAVIKDGKMIGIIEFNTADKSEVKLNYTYDFQSTGKKLKLAAEGIQLNWELVDDASDALSGNWRIIGREQDSKIIPMNPGARKTVKILSGTRFQWVAINTETGDFFGTGGGNYSFINGKYTENIEFFSRDASRVGASLSFNAEIKNGDWHHSGLSSKGDKIYEIWSRK
jgi:hypothetical protein